MIRHSVRFAVWWRWFRRSHLPGAVIATLFVIALTALGLYGLAEKHGFHLAGG